jgi:hypothetical protein
VISLALVKPECIANTRFFISRAGSFIPGKGIRSHESFDQLLATNPALETFKGGKKTKSSFIPGKGIRAHESFDQLLATNPALETFKGGKKTKSSFIPGKGIRAHESFVV